MPIHVKWYYEDKSVLYVQLDGKWELIDFVNMYDESRGLSKNTTHKYITVVDFTTSTSLPAKILAAGDKIKEPEGTNMPVITIMVGMGRIYEMMLNLITRIYPASITNVVPVNTLEEGLALANETLAKAQNLQKN